MARLDILIVGTSIAGPAFASFLLLSPLKVNITLLERAPRVRPEGQNIDIRGIGIDSIRRLGLERTIRANLTREAGVQLVNSHNQVVASIPASKAGERQGPTADLEMLRGTLARLLVEKCEALDRQLQRENPEQEPNVQFIFDDYVQELEQEGDAVRVRFAKSKLEQRFDLVVGADGLQSRTRQQAFGSDAEIDAQRLHNLGIYGAFFSIPRTAGDTDWRRWFHAPGRRSMMLRPSDRPDRTTVFMHKKSDDPCFSNAARSRDVAAQKALIRETFADMEWHGESQRILAELSDSNDFYYDMFAQVKMEKWSKGRIVLIGDAAHCTSPLSGMGTSLALAGAYNLAGSLALNPDDILAALQQYEKAQRPLVNSALRLSPAARILFGNDKAWQIWLFHCFAACVALLAPIFNVIIGLFAPDTITPTLPDYGIRTASEV